jgi:hypothetical protein
MPSVQLNDAVFKVAQQKAADKGYSSVDQYIADILVSGSGEESDDFDHFFTPERVNQLRQISAEIKAGGRTYTMAEMEEHFESKRRAWLAKHAS